MRDARDADEIDAAFFARSFFALKNPHANTYRIRALLSELRDVLPGLYDELDSLLQRWLADERPNVNRYLAAFYHAIRQPNVGVGDTVASLIWALPLD